MDLIEKLGFCGDFSIGKLSWTGFAASVWRIRTHPVGAGVLDGPRSNSPGFRKPLGEFANGCAFAQRCSMSRVYLRGKGKPFPYRGTAADSPGVGNGFRYCCAACRVGTPYNGARADAPEAG